MDSSLTPASVHRRRHLAVAVAGLVILLGVGGCGGSDAGTSVGSSTGSSAGTARRVAPTEGAPARLLDPAAFAAFLAAHPDAPLINVHTPYEGHIEGTDRFVPFDQIGSAVGLPADRSAPLVIYCRSGNMSGEAAGTLSEMGFTDIVDLAGGMRAWEESGRSLVTDPSAAEDLNLLPLPD